jgi:arylsulfatase
MGPYRQWPTGMGFDYFYGFLGGETNQWYPAVYEGTTPVEPPGTPEEGYYFNDDLSDHAIKWMRQQKALMPDAPFFAYYAPGATHAPHHVPVEWADKYKGKFDDGWDALREATFARQKELGVIPPDCDLTQRSPGIPAWSEIDDDMKPVLARQMEVYAGYLENTDHHVGLLLDALQDMEILDETLIITIIGDNGASAEGSLQGTFNEMITLGGFAALETPEFLKSKIDDLGGPDAYNHYAVGWAHAMDTPYQWTKQVASHFGGTRNGTIVHWPGGIEARGEVRPQFHHVIDIAPTVLELAGLPQPTFVNGVQQKPMEGVSMAYSFDDAAAPERHETQYFEMFGNRGIYHKGWTAVTKHRTPWETGADAVTPAFDDDVWELYDTTTDWTQAHDLAREHPRKLHELQRLWLIEAVKYNVVPLDDRFVERGLPDSAGRPTLIHGTKQLLFSGMGRLTENSVLMMKNTSFSLTAEVDVPAEGAEGVIVAQGGISGGHSFYAKDGALKYCYNFFGLEQYYVAATAPVPPGEHQVRMEFAYDGGGVGKGGEVTLYVDGAPVGSGRVEQTEAFLFSADETCDVGNEFGSPVTTDYSRRAFTGDVRWVEIDLGADDHNHLIKPEDRVKVAMGIQ